MPTFASPAELRSSVNFGDLPDDVLGIVLSFHEQNNNFMRARAETCIQSRWRDKMLRELQKARQNAKMMMNLLFGSLGLRVYQIQYLMDAQNS